MYGLTGNDACVYRDFYFAITCADRQVYIHHHHWRYDVLPGDMDWISRASLLAMFLTTLGSSEGEYAGRISLCAISMNNDNRVYWNLSTWNLNSPSAKCIA